MSIKTAACGDTPPLIHNKTQLLAPAGGSPAKAVMRQTCHWINVTLNHHFLKLSWLLLQEHWAVLLFFAALIENGTVLGYYCVPLMALPSKNIQSVIKKDAVSLFESQGATASLQVVAVMSFIRLPRL